MCTMHLLRAIPNAGKYLELSIEGPDYYPWQEGLFLGTPYHVEDGHVTVTEAPAGGWRSTPTGWRAPATGFRKGPHDARTACPYRPEGLEEFSVVFTDRSLNHMSARFQGVMRDVSGMLKEVYRGSAVALVPGGGTYAMEAVARQFGKGRVLVVRNGWFSFRWTQIFDAGGFAAEAMC